MNQKFESYKDYVLDCLVGEPIKESNDAGYAIDGGQINVGYTVTGMQAARGSYGTFSPDLGWGEVRHPDSNQDEEVVRENTPRVTSIFDDDLDIFDDAHPHPTRPSTGNVGDPIGLSDSDEDDDLFDESEEDRGRSIRRTPSPSPLRGSLSNRPRGGQIEPLLRFTTGNERVRVTPSMERPVIGNGDDRDMRELDERTINSRTRVVSSMDAIRETLSDQRNMEASILNSNMLIDYVDRISDNNGSLNEAPTVDEAENDNSIPNDAAVITNTPTGTITPGSISSYLDTYSEYKRNLYSMSGIPRTTVDEPVENPRPANSRRNRRRRRDADNQADDGSGGMTDDGNPLG